MTAKFNANLRRYCPSCEKVRSIRDFYRGRAICKFCVGEQASRSYTIRTVFQDDFICRQCGLKRTADQASSYAENLCRTCHAENLRKKKEAAPALLKCRHCGRKKPKGEFSRYSLTCCKVCAARLARERKKQEVRG